MKQITILNDNMTYHLLIDDKSVWLNMAELVTLKNTIETAIQSGFKEGDFLLFEGEYDLVTIFAAYTSDGSWHEHASISLGSMELQTGLHITANDCEGYKVRRATDEEKKILLDALDEHGYAWNPETKKVEKKAKTSQALQVGKYYYFKVGSRLAYVAKLITANDCERNIIGTLRFGENIVWNPRKNDFRESEYDDTTLVYNMRNCRCIRPASLHEIQMLEQKRSLREANLKPFCKVLVRDNKEDKWKPAFFVKISNNEKLPYNCVSLVSGHNSSYMYCIPYEGNESLAFTIPDKPPF